jgi:lysophospholipase L1-like esterase
MTKLLLLGDSLLAEHDWQKRLPTYKIDNLAVPGAQAADLLALLAETKEQALEADIVVLMIGTNDLLQDNHLYLQQLKQILIAVSHQYPAAEILVNSLLPMELPHLPDNAVSSLNQHIEALTMRTGCCFLDLYKRFLTATKPLFQDDGVHLTAAGYAVWERALLEHIAFLIEND